MNSLIIIRKILIPIVGFLFFSTQLFSSSITGAGSSFIYPLMTSLAKMYYTKTGKEINYQAVGSSAGFEMLMENTIDFCATEILLTQDKFDSNKFVIVPIGASGIVPVVNIRGIKDNQLVLDGNTLALIYLGKITYWDDPAVKKLNPNLSLPHNKIVLVTRIGMSGTTYTFSKYLSMINAEWSQKVGTSSVINWPKTCIGGRDNAGVAGYLKQISNSIGYVEYTYLVANGIPTKVRMVNKEEKIVSAGYDSFYSAIVNYDWSSKSFLINTPGENSWPIVGLTYFIAKKDKMNKELCSFIEFIINDQAARKKAEEMGYVLPAKALHLETNK